MDCEKCINEQRLIALEEDKKRNSEQHKEFYEQLKDIAVGDGRKEERENARDRQLSDILKMIGELKQSIAELQNRPMRQADSIRDKVIDKLVTAAFFAIGGYILYVLK